MAQSSTELKNEILNGYYSEIYHWHLFGKSVQGKGIAYFEKSIEKYWDNSMPDSVLELGGGSGEHFQYISYVPSTRYDLIDLMPPFTDEFLNKISPELKAKLNLVIGNAQELPYGDELFDRVFSTCLLHHVDDVLAVLMETRRVSRRNAEILFALPTDPGLLNRLIKKIYSFPRIRKHSRFKPELIYALEHKNHVNGILELIRMVYEQDKINIKYRPFPFLKSWNLNLFVLVIINKT